MISGYTQNSHRATLANCRMSCLLALGFEALLVLTIYLFFDDPKSDTITCVPVCYVHCSSKIHALI